MSRATPPAALSFREFLIKIFVGERGVWGVEGSRLEA